MINPKDKRLYLAVSFTFNNSADKAKLIKKEPKPVYKKSKLDGTPLEKLEKEKSAMFFSYNTALGPPYRIIMDTNFINFSIQNKMDILRSMMDCLLAKCIPCVTDCVVAELEKLGHKYRLALRLVKDFRFERITCCHKGTYADDCLVNLAKQHRCYIVATCDKDLKRRIRKIPGVPIMHVSSHKYQIERMPESLGEIAK